MHARGEAERFANRLRIQFACLIAFIQKGLPNVEHAARCTVANGDLSHAIYGPAQIARVLLRQHL